MSSDWSDSEEEIIIPRKRRQIDDYEDVQMLDSIKTPPSKIIFKTTTPKKETLLKVVEKSKP